MPTFTANYLFSKPAGTDSPDGAAQISTVADQVDSALATTLQSFEAIANAQLTVTSSFQDVPGTSQSITVLRAHAVAQVIAVFDVSATVTTGNNVFVGILAVDGVGQTAEAHADDRVSRTTGAAQTYRVSLAAGTHTLKLQAKALAGSFVVNSLHTTMQVTVLDLP